MELYNGRYCATYDDLAGFMTRDQIMHYVQRGKVERVCRGGNGRIALYAVDSLPAKFKAEVYRRNPDLQAQAESKKFIDAIIRDESAAVFYAEYKIDEVRKLDYDKQAEYTNNASILEAFQRVIDRANSRRKAVSPHPRLRKTDFWMRAAKALPRIADRFPNSLPENPRRLQQKFNEFFAGGKPNYEVLISAKFQNANASKINTEEQKSVMIRLMSDHRNLDDEQVTMLYNLIAEKMEWAAITSSAVKTWRRKYDLETAAGRLGEKEFYNQRAMQVTRSAPTAPLYMWSLDGWDVELYYQKTVNRKGKTVTTYSNRLTVVVVLDPFNKYPIGYAIGEQECAELIKAALRNAANHTAELFGGRYRAHQIQSDHYALKTMLPIYGVSGETVTPARVGNAKSKPIERYFGTLNKTYCQLWHNWSGFGITSNKNLQPNADALNAMRHSFPDEAGCREQIEFIIASERAKKRAKFVAAWQRMPAERQLPMSDEQYLLTFGAETGDKNALEGQGLVVKLLGAKRTYDCFDLNFRRYAHLRWNVKYDPDNLDRVLAVSDDGSLRFMLESKFVQPMALIDRRDGDAEQLARVWNFNTEQLMPHVIGTISAAHEKVDELFAHNPALNNTLSRAVICDSLGQHKDRRNEKRLSLPIEDAEQVIDQPAAARKPSTFEFY